MMLLQRNLPTFSRNDFYRELDRLVDGFLGRNAFPDSGRRPFPALNTWEDAEKLYLEAEVPGLGLDDIEILIQGNELTLKGMRKPADSASVTYHRRERGVGEFTRLITLPVDVDGDRVEAALKNGVLTIVLPKAERARARKIAVQSA
jgi:HSP20 family protein